MAILCYNSTMVLYLIITYFSLIAFGLLMLAISNFFHSVRSRNGAVTVLEVRVPKTNEENPIVAEQFFATLHGVYKKHSIFKRFFGAQQLRISCEIVRHKGAISFYLWFPKRLRTLVEGQLYAQYPNAEIEEVADYFEAHTDEKLIKKAVALELHLHEPTIFPIKRYGQFEDKLARRTIDPLAGVTATLSHLLHPNDGASIQFIISPTPNRLRTVFLNCLRIIAKGVFGNIDFLKKIYIKTYITRSNVLKILFFPLYFVFWFKGFFTSMKGGVIEVSSSHDELNEEVTMSHDKETEVSAAVSKVAKHLFNVTIRICYLPTTVETSDEEAVIKVREIAGSFKQFDVPYINSFSEHDLLEGEEAFSEGQKRSLTGDMVLNTEELATLYHLPHMSVATPNMQWVRSRKLEPPLNLPIPTNDGATDSDSNSVNDITMLGATNFRGIRREFGIKQIDRRRHMYVIGKTGQGKSTLLENMIFSDIQAGKGVAVIDPHGDLAEKVIDFVPSHRTNDVILFDPSDMDFPVAFNMLENIDPTYNSIVTSGLIGVFKKLYAESWGPRLEHILRNTVRALLDYPNTTMLGITRILQDADYRKKVVRKITDPVVLSFWKNEFEKLDPKLRIEAISPILNKVGQFLSSPIIRNIVGQPKSSFSLRFAMDKKKIVIINLSKGKIGEDTSSLLGSMLITKFQLDAMSRANVAENQREDFYLYVDEFQNFATESFATILSEARKYRLNLTMANQYIAQMPEEVRDAVFGNVGSLTSFQVGYDDAEAIAGQFGGDETMIADLVALNMGNTYLRLLIDGQPTPVFSMSTFPPQPVSPEIGRREKILKFCRERYSTPRDVVEDKIMRWSSTIETEEEATQEKKPKRPKKDDTTSNMA